jgi:hypothetical protein
MSAELNPLCAQLAGRIAYLRDVGRVKDPGLMQEALDVISGLVGSTRALLDDMGTPDDGMQANLMSACRAAIAKATGEAA